MKFKVFLIFCLIFSSLTTLSSVSATDDINQTDEFLDDSDDNVFDSVNHTQLLYNDSSDDVELVLDNMSEFNDFYKEDVQFNSKVNDSSLEIKSNFSIADDMSVSSNSAYLSTTLAGDDLKFYYKNGKYVAILKDSYGNSLSNKNVVITVSGVSYTKVTDSLGKASLNINLNPGTYPISAVFKGDSVYKSSSVSNTLTIMSTLEGSNLVKSYRNASQFYVRAYLNTGGFLKNKNLSMDIKGVIYQRATDEAGLARLNINLDPGTYIITVTNPNDGLKYSYNITIVKEDVVLSADNFVINRVGEYYQAKLTDKYGHALVNKTINIVANGVSYSRITDSNGIAKLKINYNTVAAYTVYCTFSGDVGYNGIITSTKTINRVSSSTKLNVNLLVNDTLFKQKGEYIYGILKDNNGFPMANYQVKYIVNGVTYTSTTDSEGVAKTSINLNSGKYTLNSIFAGSTYYNSVQKNNIITMDFTPNVAYSFKVPMYVNVTGLTVSKSYSNSKYVMEEGVNGNC